MTAINLIFVETRGNEKRDLLCRWVEHFYEHGKKAQILVDSTMAAQHVDQLLWTFSQSSFIPHTIITAAPPQGIIEPIVITVGSLHLEGFDILFADGSANLDFLSKYRSAVHFVLMDDTDQRQESRLLWQAAKEQGYQLRHVPYSSNLKSIQSSP